MKETKTLDMPAVAPQSKGSVKMPFAVAKDGNEYAVNCYAVVKDSFDVFEKGDVVAYEQLDLTGFIEKKHEIAKGKTVFNEDGKIILERSCQKTAVVSRL